MYINLTAIILSFRSLGFQNNPTTQKNLFIHLLFCLELFTNLLVALLLDIVVVAVTKAFTRSIILEYPPWVRGLAKAKSKLKTFLVLDSQL